MKKGLIGFAACLTSMMSMGQISAFSKDQDSLSQLEITARKFSACTEFLDAAINSINAFNILVKKENYRVKIISLNNPSSNDLGFNLENEINTALKPLLSKSKQVQPEKFSQVVASIIHTPEKLPVAKTLIYGMNPMFSSLLGMVGNLAVSEKKITREDIDSFILSTSKYFILYQKLNLANHQFDQSLNQLITKVTELQYDTREFLIDLISILYKDISRNQVKNLTSEDLYLKFLEKDLLQKVIFNNQGKVLKFPSDGVKNAKEIAYSLQKLFNEYQKIYNENYLQIRSILLESKSFGKNINHKLIEASLKELETLYNESRQSDNLGLRLNTLFDRLKVISGTDQLTVTSG